MNLYVCLVAEPLCRRSYCETQPRELMWEKPKGIYESVSFSCGKIPKEGCKGKEEDPNMSKSFYSKPTEMPSKAAFMS